MKHSHHEKTSRVASRVSVAAGATLLALLTGLSAGPAHATDNTDANASCRQQTKRVAVWPRGPKNQNMARFEEREVTVCDGNVVSQRSTKAASQAKGK